MSAKRLRNKVYHSELDCGESYKVWAYRKAAWNLDDLTRSLSDVYGLEGLIGHQRLLGVGERLSKEIENELMNLKAF